MNAGAPGMLGRASVPTRAKHQCPSVPSTRPRFSAPFQSLFLALSMLFVLSGCGAADATGGQVIPKVTLGVDQAQGPQDTVQSIQIIVLLTVLSLAPAILIMVTAFTRIIIVLSLIRNAIGVPQLPPNQVLIGLALFLTFFVMAPVAQQVEREAYSPFVDGKVTQSEAFAKAEAPLRTFMLRQVREKDLALFVYLARLDQPKSIEDVPTYVVIPSFIISELKTAFQMGFVIFIPFLVIDLVVSTVLMSMGMMMLPPVLISLPFKILLFVMVDGWYLLMRALVLSFN